MSSTSSHRSHREWKPHAHRRLRRAHRIGARRLRLEPLEPRWLLAFDFGDAPDDGAGSLLDYPVMLAQNGARHEIVAGFCLGAEVDSEADGQPSAEANADDLSATPDDEEGVHNVGGGGVMITGGLKRGAAAATLEVFVTNTAGVANPYLDAWIDFNADGDWDDSGERIASQAVAAGASTLSFAVPEYAALGQTYSRFRLHSATGPGLLPTGPTGAGEVEDHAVLITFDVTNPDQVAKLLAADGAAGDYFGNAVAISGDTAVVAAPGDDDGGSDSGSAYVFIRGSTGWTQQAKLTADDAAAGDAFGKFYVAISGDTVVVGTPYDDDAGSNSGSAYVFTRSGGVWTQQAKLTAGDAAADDWFGWEVAISGDTVVVGARGDNDAGANSGSAYVFVRSGSTWTQQAKLTAADAAAVDEFGTAAISGDTIVVGAWVDDAGAVDSGSAYVFTRSGSTWTQQAKLTAADAAAYDYFGGTVAIAGDTVVVGAWGDDDGGTDSGSAYVFVRSGNNWTQQAKLTAADAAAGDGFSGGAISGDTVVAGAQRDNGDGTFSGSAYVFTRNGSSWTQQARLTFATDDTGGSLAFSGDTAVVGVPGDNDRGSLSGSAYVFDLVPTEHYGDAPTVIGTNPSFATSGVLAAGTTSLEVEFSEPVVGGDVAENYQLQSLGADGLLGTADDALVPLSVAYSGTTATLSFAALPASVFRLTVRDAIVDPADNALDGDGDGTAGGDAQRDFVALPPAEEMFEAIPTYLCASGGSGPRTLTAGDFNADGNTDLAVANVFSDTVGVLLGDGAGGFADAVAYASGGNGPHAVTTGDFNGDGHGDLAVANGNSGTVGVLLGDGAGGFADAATYASGGSGSGSVTVGDFNGDGHGDLAVNNWGTNHVGLLLGDGSGGFAAAVTYPSGGNGPTWVTVGDFNADGKADLAVTNSESQDVGVLLNDGAGGFADATSYSSGGIAPAFVTVGDFNADGHDDLAVANGGSDNVGVLLGNGAGGFAAATTFPSGGAFPVSVTVSDFNGDGTSDLAIANHDSGNVRVLLGNGAGGFAAASTYASGGDGSGSAALGDFNGDGKTDLAIPHVYSDTVGVLLGDDAGGFAAAYASGGDFPRSVTVGDFNADGHDDLAAANESSDTVGVLLNDGAGGFAGAVTYASGGDGPNHAAVGDFNGDGKTDLAVAHRLSDNVGVLLGDGAGGFAAAAMYASGGSAPYGMTVGDFNADGHDDLAVANYGPDNVGVLLGDGAGGFAAATTYASGGSGPVPVTVGDFNADGHDDLAVANWDSGTVGALLNDGAGAFAAATIYASGGDNPSFLSVGDFNTDGWDDLAVAHAGSNTVGVLLGDGVGGFTAATAYGTGGDAPYSVTVGDFNADGKTDLAVANYNSHNVGVLLGNGAGGFAAAVSYASGGYCPVNVSVGDFDADGKTDLAVANLCSDSLGILLGRGRYAPGVWHFASPQGVRFDVQTHAFGTGQLVEATDQALDGTGRLEVAGQPYAPTATGEFLTDGDRTLVTPSVLIAGLDVAREITVPAAGSEDFARTVDVFSNPTGSRITTTVRIVGNLGSDAATTVWGTSDGDTLVEPSDQWIGTDDADGAGTPAIVHYVHGPAGLEPASIAVSGDNIEWTYNVTVPAGETVRLAHFTILGADRAAAQAAANVLVTAGGFGGEAAAFLTCHELASILNFDSAPPTVLWFAPVGPRNTTVDRLQVQFNEALAVGSFGPEDVGLVGPAGPVGPAGFTVQPLGPGRFDVLIPPQSQAGDYQVTLGPAITDLLGNPLEGGAFHAAFTIDLTGPRITDLEPAGTVTEPVAQLDVTFQEPLAAGTFDADDVTLAGPDASPIPVSDPLLVSGTTYRLTFAPQTANGLYTLTIGPGMCDLAGNALDQDADGNPGEPVDDVFTGTFTVALPNLVVGGIQAPGTARPGSAIEVAWDESNSGLQDVGGVRTTNVYLSADASVGGDRLLGSFPFSDTVPQGGSLPRTATVTLPAHGFLGPVRIVVELDAQRQIPETDDGDNAALDDAAIQVPLVLTLTAPVSEIREDAANPVIRAVVGRSAGVDQPLVVSLASSDTSELAVPESVTIGPGQYETLCELTVQNDGVLDGSQPLQISATAADAEGVSLEITVLDAQPVHLTLDIPAAQLAEGDTVTATIMREFFTSGELLVSLTSSNLSQLAVPASVTILDGQAATTFSVTAVQDMLLELNHEYTVAARAAGFVDGSDQVTVLDEDVPSLTLTLETTVIIEGAGPLATIATLTRDPVSDRAVSVNLGSSDPTEAVVPSRVTLPANVASVRFYVSAVEDLDVDGIQPVTLSATPTETGTGWPITSAAVVQALQVTDNDGPTLWVDVAANLVSEGLTPATTVTIRRNTGTAGALVVDLAVSDPAEASLPAQATIPDGSDSVTVPVDSLQDGVNDGLKFVQISASAAGFAPGVDTLVVSDVDLPDLVIDILSAPTAALTGELVSVSYEVRNAGIFAVDGHYVTRTYLSGDPYPGHDTLVDEFPFTGLMPVDAAFQRSVSVPMPDVVGRVYVLVVVDADSEVQEGVEGNNADVSAAIDVQAAYTVTVQTEVTVAASGTTVPLYGTATLTGGQPAANVPVAIDVKVNGTRRRIAALADATGAFAVDFAPLPGEVGDFTIGACHPGVGTAPDQDQFTLFGFRAEPEQVKSALVEQTPQTETVTLRNLSQFALSGLQAEVLDAPANLQVTVSFPQGTDLAGHGTVPAEIQLVALDASVLSGAFRVRFTAAEGGVPVDRNVSFRVQPLHARLVSDVAQLVATMVRGEQRVVEFTLRNAGGAASGDVQVLLPGAPWLSLASPAVIPSLAAGQSASVTLILRPAADLPLTLYNGTIACNATDASLLMPFAFRNVSQAQGDLLVQAVDELYFFDPDQPGLAGATVIVRDAVTGQELTTGTTDADGQWLMPGLNEATYTVEVYAPKHDTFRSTVAVAGGQVNELQAFLSRQTVQYEWTVAQIEIEDRYLVTVEAVFETVVPAPVVTVDPTVIDLYPLQYLGDARQVDLRIENHGLVQAEDVRISLPTHPVYAIQALIDTVPLLAAQSSVTIPLLIQRTTSDAAGACALWGSVTWSYDAGPYQVGKQTPLRFLNVDGSCPVQPSPVVGGSGGWDGGSGSGGGGGGGGAVPSVTPVYFPPPVEQAAVDLRLRIDQELVTTRSAFEATLDLTNNNSDIPLTEIFVGVEIYDAGGHPANDLFQVRPPALVGLNAVDGTGELGPEANGSSSWVLVPTDQAAPLEPTVYYVGGRLSFQEGDQPVDIEFTRVQITVQPDAALWLKYFLQRDVYSDDPFTAPVEPAQPFVLGMLLDNRGAGTARDLRITSADPQIVDNDHGLLIDFDLLATQIDNQNLTPSFTASFGDVAPGQLRVGQWYMTASLHGQFTEYSASFEHLTGLGDPRVSLIKSVEVRELIHPVLATDPGADDLPDFLTNDLADAADLPDTVHLSDGSVRSVGLLTEAAFDGAPVVGDLQVQLTVTPLAGFGYLRTADPGNGLFRLVRVQRSDGGDLPLQNFWQTDRTFGDPQQRPTYENLLHLFDDDSTGSYTLSYETGDVTPPAIARLEEVQPDPRITAVSTVEVTFSEAIHPASFDISDVSLRRDGGANLIDGRVTIVPQSTTVFQIAGLGTLTGDDGCYELTVDAAGITDVVGHPGVGAGTESWLKAEHVPYMVDIAGVPEPLRKEPVAQVVVTFSEPVQPASLTDADLQLLRDGTAVSLAGALTVTQTGAASYTISGLDAATAPEGAYVLTVDAGGVCDLDGLPGLGSLSISWRMEIPTLTVTELAPTGSGFIAWFGRELEASVLNVYDSASQTLGPADVSVTGATVGPVRGSLVMSADRRQITFVQTGGLLEPDTYTVTLFSGATRFRQPSGGMLDGNADGTPGDDYQTTFTVAARPAGMVTIRLPDLARGAGQGVNVPNTDAGLPIRLDNAAGVTSLAADVLYDPVLLDITAATLAAGLPDDWSVVLDTGTAGVAKITASGTTPLAGSNLDVVRLTTAVPSDAPYGAVQAIRLENVSLNGGTIAAVGDVGVHKAVYLGDADGSGIHSSADAFLTVQAALGLAGGFAAHAWTDPRIVGDTDGSGVLSAADAFLIVQEGLGLSEPFVPDNPHVTITPVGGGVDPQFRIGVNLPASAGGLVSVPVQLAIEPAATNVGALDFDLFFDASRLTIPTLGGISAGADTAEWAVTTILVAPGQLRVGMVSASGRPLAVGLREIARLQFRVEAGKSSRTGRQPVPDGLPTRPTLLPPITDHRLLITDVWDGSETHPTWLNIEPVDARAGGYAWTASDGSLLIGPARAATDGRRPLGRVAESVEGIAEWLAHDLLDEVLSPEDALAAMVADVAVARR